jgi:hypothetical protein
MLLPLLAMGTLLGGGTDDACDIDDIVLAVSAAMEGDLIDDTVGEVMDCDAIDGVLIGCTGCIGI